MELTQSVEPTLEATLSPLLERRLQLKATEALTKRELETVNDEIKNALVQAGELDVVVDGQRVTLDMEREKSTLDKQRLLELGVSTEQIKRATKVSTYVQLDVRKAAKAE
jgi:hypothetical protein